jgi:uncharacterized membrane protein YecN with MAPEG domain
MITSIYTALLGFLFFNITMTVIKGRVKNEISLGPGKNNEIEHLVSAHSNFVAYTPFFLITLFVLEYQKANIYALHALGIIFLTGRIMHYIGMKGDRMNFKFRRRGMMLTMWPILVSLAMCIIYPVLKMLA